MVVLVQHGKAKDEKEDPTRPLTDEGRAETRKVAKFISRFFRADRIYHSGKRRAEETARELAEFVGGDVVKIEGIAPLDPPDAVVKIAETEGKDRNIVVVGHLPNLSRAVEKLCGSECVKFIYSGAVALEKEGERWMIKWFVTPGIVE